MKGSLLEIPVISKNGLRGKVFMTSRLLDWRPEKSILFESGRKVEVASRHLHLRTDGTYFLNLTVNPDPQVVIPIIEERAEVSTRTVETGRVRVEKISTEAPVIIDEPTIHEEYEVHHIPKNTVVDEEEPTRVEGDTTIIPVYEEEVVTTKRLVLREEIHLVKKRREDRSPIAVNLRKDDIEIQRTNLDRPLK